MDLNFSGFHRRKKVNCYIHPCSCHYCTWRHSLRFHVEENHRTSSQHYVSSPRQFLQRKFGISKKSIFINERKKDACLVKLDHFIPKLTGRCILGSRKRQCNGETVLKPEKFEDSTSSKVRGWGISCKFMFLWHNIMVLFFPCVYSSTWQWKLKQLFCVCNNTWGHWQLSQGRQNKMNLISWLYIFNDPKICSITDCSVQFSWWSCTDWGPWKLFVNH